MTTLPSEQCCWLHTDTCGDLDICCASCPAVEPYLVFVGEADCGDGGAEWDQ